MKFYFSVLCLLIQFASIAQNSIVGDGFGGRLWYKPYNYAVGSYSGHTLCGPERSLYSWGAGPMGDSVTPISNVIYKAVGLDSVLFYTTGYVMAAIRNDNTGWFWDGNFPGIIPVPIYYPKKVIDSVKFVDVAQAIASFVKLDGTVWTMGFNIYGEFGNGQTSLDWDSIPRKMIGINDAVRTACGQVNTYILRANGEVWATGFSDYNGNNVITGAADSIPKKIANLENIIDIKANSGIVVALDKDGFVWTFGPSAPYLGYLDTSNIIIPRKVPTLSNIVAISSMCDGGHVLALDKDSNCYAWGENFNGNCGLPIIQPISVIEIPTLAATGVVDILAGELFSYIIKADGSLWAAGTSNAVSIYLNLSDTTRETFTKLDPTAVPFNLCPAFQSIPDVNANFSTSLDTICINDCINFTAQNIFNANYNWTFNGANTTSSIGQNPNNICYPNAGTYTVTLVVSKGAEKDTSSKIIFVRENPIAIIEGDSSVCRGESLTLTAVNTAEQYLWSNGANTSSITISPTQNQLYTLVTSNGNCSDSDSLFVIIDSCLQLSFPNGFTPNGDKINDGFFPNDYKNIELAEYNLKVFNRLGEKIFESSDIKNGWLAQEADLGIYFYLCTYKTKQGKLLKASGDVLLLK
jgi:hypothetical protein